MEHEIFLRLEDLDRRQTFTELYLNYLISKEKIPRVSDEELVKFAKEQDAKAKTKPGGD